MGCEVSIARQGDAEAIAGIFRQTSLLHQQKAPDIFKPAGYDKDLSYVTDCLGQQNVKIFKAEADGQIAGYLVMYLNEYPEEFFVDSKYGFVGSLGVDEKYRGLGIGQSLILEAENYLKAHGIKAMEIDVYTFNSGAEKLYDKMGYKDIKHYKRKVLE